MNKNIEYINLLMKLISFLILIFCWMEVDEIEK